MLFLWISVLVWVDIYWKFVREVGSMLGNWLMLMVEVVCGLMLVVMELGVYVIIMMVSM